MDENFPILTITLYPRVSSCLCCERELVGCKRGVPFYEDFVLPDVWVADGVDWQLGWGAERGGHDVCDPCAEIQATLTEPMSTREVARRAYPATPEGIGHA